MTSDTARLSQSVAGVMAAERRIIQLAESRGLRGLRFEWNDDVDFGHMQDPVPVSIFAPGGRMVEAAFTLAELEKFAAGQMAAGEGRFAQVVDALADAG